MKPWTNYGSELSDDENGEQATESRISSYEPRTSGIEDEIEPEVQAFDKELEAAFDFDKQSDEVSSLADADVESLLAEPSTAPEFWNLQKQSWSEP